MCKGVCEWKWLYIFIEFDREYLRSEGFKGFLVDKAKVKSLIFSLNKEVLW